jgi:hypothetical protein
MDPSEITELDNRMKEVESNLLKKVEEDEMLR